VACSAFAQGNLTPTEIELKSYDDYQNEKWDEVIAVVNQAHEQGIDYYYLEARIGTAWFKKGNYRKAANAFRKAITFNQSSYAKENLYYSLLYSGDENAARMEALKFGDTFREKVNEKKINWLDFAYAEGGLKVSTDDPPNGNISYGTLGLEHQFGGRLSIYHAFTYLQQPKYGNKLTQKQYFIQPKVQITQNLSVSAGLHILGMSFADSTYTDWCAAIAVKEKLAFLDIVPFLAFANVNGYHIMQAGASVSWYPFGNLNFYGTSTIDFHHDSLQNHVVLKQSLTVKTFDYLWLTGEVAKNDELLRVSGDNLSVLNNSYDLNNYQYSLMATVPVSKRISLYLLFMKENKNLKNENTIGTLTYKFNTFIGGLKFNL